MTLEEERESARRLCASKYDVWNAFLSCPYTLDKVLDFCENSSEINFRKHKKKIDTSKFKVAKKLAKIFQKDKSDRTKELYSQAISPIVNALIAYDPCLDLAVEIRNIANDPDNLDPRCDYESYSLEMRKAWNRFVFFRNKFIECNLGLVFMVYKRYSNVGLPKDDMIQEGIIGLNKAAGLFNLDRKTKFSTYAAWWIRAFMVRYCRNRSRIVRVPVGMQDKYERYKKVIANMEKDGQPFDKEIIAKKLKSNVVMVEKMIELGENWDYVSLDFQTETGRSMIDFLQDESDLHKDMDDQFDLNIAWGHITGCMNKLSEREKEIIQKRFGLDGKRQYTLKEIGKKLSVSRERTRQIESFALDKIRDHIDSNDLGRICKAAIPA